MSLARVTCPECGAGMKSAAGFTPGQKVRCPKCQTVFQVEAPAFEEVEEPAPAPARQPARAAAVDDDEDDRPRRRRDDDDEEDEDDRPRKRKKAKADGYANSPLRYAVLGVLLVVLGVLGFLLYQKRQREKDEVNKPVPADTNDDEDLRKPIRPDARKPAGGGPTNAEQARAATRLKEVMIAMLICHEQAGGFPPAAICDKNGKPLLSWRVALLPYIEQEALYKQFKLNEPWDSPNNKPLVARMPTMYRGGLNTNSGTTCFKVFVGGGALFDLTKPVKFTDIKDGSSNTIAVVEAGPPVPWTKPDDIPYDPLKPLPDLTPPDGGDTVLVSMAHGSTRWASRAGVPEANWRAAITANGGEKMGLDD